VPIYEYGCSACRKRSSALLPAWSAPDPPCPHCGKTSLRRLVSSFATVRSEEVGFDSDDGAEDFDSGGGDFGDDDW
jgi:putative FmdB family regulatory protein